MRRAILIGLLTLAVGCASTRETKLEAENEALRRQLRARREPSNDEVAPLGPQDVVSPSALSDPPYFGDLGGRPDYCNDGMCLEIQNHMPGNAALWINCEPAADATCRPVAIRGAAFLPPGGIVHVRVYRPGSYRVRAVVYNTVHVGWGRTLPSPLARWSCAIERAVGSRFAWPLTIQETWCSQVTR